jgi:predicted RNase H-like HicB family nuclease
MSCEHASMSHIVYKVETEVEADGRWIAEVVDLPGVMAYGSTEKEVVASVQALALRVLADRIEEQKEPAETVTVSIEAA